MDTYKPSSETASKVTYRDIEGLIEPPTYQVI